jgi:hypothetical protein
VNNFTRFSVILVVLFTLVSALAQAIRLDGSQWPVVIAPISSTLSEDQSTTYVNVGLNQAGTSSTTMSVTSSHPGLVSVPSTITVPSGVTSWQFGIAAMGYPIGIQTKTKAQGGRPGTQVTITVSANGRSAYTYVTVQ